MRALKILVSLILAYGTHAQAQSLGDPVLESTMKAFSLSEADARAQLATLDEANRVGNRLKVEEPTRYVWDCEC